MASPRKDPLADYRAKRDFARTAEPKPKRAKAAGSQFVVQMHDAARLKGRWHLVRMKPRSGEKRENWLLIKSDDEFARPPGGPDITDEEATSQLSGLTTKELAAQGALRTDHAARADVAKKRKV